MKKILLISRFKFAVTFFRSYIL
uniref:Uncharacterized protein n=1 Tax=Arundo donax TaxID=35708 RepID=A0A0A9FAU2_ARUDO